MDHYTNPEDPFWQSQPEALSVGIINPASEVVAIHGRDGRVLLTIHNDGTVEGEIEDTGEAASRFVEFVRGLMEVKWEYYCPAHSVPGWWSETPSMHIEVCPHVLRRRAAGPWEKVE